MSTATLTPSAATDVLSEAYRGTEKDRLKTVEIIRDGFAAIANGEAVANTKQFGAAMRDVGMSQAVAETYCEAIRSSTGRDKFYVGYDATMAALDEQERQARQDCETHWLAYVAAKRIRDQVVPAARQRIWAEQQQWTFFEQVNPFLFSDDLSEIEQSAKQPGLTAAEAAAIQGERLRIWHAQEIRSKKLAAIAEAAKHAK
jgi:hypothetical protein